MDFALSQAQSALLERLTTTLRAEPEQVQDRTLDPALWARLQADNFLDLCRHGQGLEQALVVERVSRAGGLVPLGLHGFVLPLFFAEDPGDIATLQDRASCGPYRYAGEAGILIRFEDEEAKAYRVRAATAKAVPTNYVYPLALVGEVEGEALARAPAAAVRRRHRQALAAEAVGAMDAALDQLCSYLTSREQFGRRLASFQALHHRLAELAIGLESARWLAREAAFDDQDETAALAAALAAKTARLLCADAHQLTGAKGFTIELGLYRHTLRLQALSVEAGAHHDHLRDAAKYAWNLEA